MPILRTLKSLRARLRRALIPPSLRAEEARLRAKMAKRNAEIMAEHLSRLERQEAVAQSLEWREKARR